MRVKIPEVIFQVIAKLWGKGLVSIMNTLPKEMMIQESDQRRRFDSPKMKRPQVVVVVVRITKNFLGRFPAMALKQVDTDFNFQFSFFADD